MGRLKNKRQTRNLGMLSPSSSSKNPQSRRKNYMIKTSNQHMLKPTLLKLKSTASSKFLIWRQETKFARALQKRGLVAAQLSKNTDRLNSLSMK